MTNLLSGMRIIAQTTDAVYLRIPREMQADCYGGCCCARPDCTGKWDTLCVPMHGKYEYSATVHMPDSAVDGFMAAFGKK